MSTDSDRGYNTTVLLVITAVIGAVVLLIVVILVILILLIRSKTNRNKISSSTDINQGKVDVIQHPQPPPPSSSDDKIEEQLLKLTDPDLLKTYTRYTNAMQNCDF